MTDDRSSGERGRRPGFGVTFLALLGLFNLVGCWLDTSGGATLYGAIAIGCFALLPAARRYDR